jgi:hypothetical protein
MGGPVPCLAGREPNSAGCEYMVATGENVKPDHDGEVTRVHVSFYRAENRSEMSRGKSEGAKAKGVFGSCVGVCFDAH